jgi:hypothetical protein
MKAAKDGVYLIRYVYHTIAEQEPFLAVVNDGCYIALTGQDTGQSFSVDNAAEPEFTPAKITEYEARLRVKVKL